MPFGDRTRPRGGGPMTGRGFRYCAGFETPGYTKGVPRGGGRGFGRGFRRGPRFGRRFTGAQRAMNQNPKSYWRPYGFESRSQEEEMQAEKEYLANEIEALEDELEAMKQRMKELNEANGNGE